MSGLGGIVAGARPFRLTLPAAPISEPFTEIAGTLLLTAGLLSVAAWNGFPIIFYDTGAYMLQGLGHVFLPERSPIYSNFLLVTGAAQSLWLVAAVQCLMTGFTMVAFARAIRPNLSLWGLLALGAVLCVGTGLPWYTGQIEPDCFVGVVPLAIYLLAFHSDELGATRKALLAVCAAVAIACHSSHIGLAAGLIAGLAAMRWLPAAWNLPRPRLILAAAILAAAVASVFAVNFIYTKDVFFSRSGIIFLEARIMEDGLIEPVLDTDCPKAGYALCPYKDELPTRADTWLWVKSRSPFETLGGFATRGKESAVLVRESLKRYPLENTIVAVQDAMLQFVWFQTGDGIVPQEWVLNSEFKSAIPHQMGAYARAYQQEGRIWFLPVNLVHVPVAIVSLGVLFWTLRRLWQRREWRKGLLPAFILLALVGNAVVCGVFSGPHGRYQSRIMWLPTFVLALLWAPRIAADVERRFGVKLLVP
jgi:hypothetical protein